MSDDGLISRIRTRRATLIIQLGGARLQYADLEETIKGQQQSLALLQRNLDAMHGGLQELDGLLAEIESEEPDA
jgi:hypothetical protein